MDNSILQQLKGLKQLKHADRTEIHVKLCTYSGNGKWFSDQTKNIEEIDAFTHPYMNALNPSTMYKLLKQDIEKMKD